MICWQKIDGSRIAWHQHTGAYAAVVLSGEYEEAGDAGRFVVGPGDVVLHERFEGHTDRFSSAGAVLLNLPLPEGSCFTPGRAQITNTDSLVRQAETDRNGAASRLLLDARHSPVAQRDWQDELSRELIHNPRLRLSEWAEARNIAPWKVSRDFRTLFGVSPEHFRLRARARLAWRAAQETDGSLASIAVDLGFADQAHMGRAVKVLTGQTPLTWRRAANRFKTGRVRQPIPIA